jgi:selenophosphate synthase
MISWEEIQRRFTRLGLDPHRLACGCAVKTDVRRVVYPAIQQLRPYLAHWGISIASREDADITELCDSPQIQRLMLSFHPHPEPSPFKGEGWVRVGRTKPLWDEGPVSLRAITLTSVYRASTPDILAERWLRVYQKLAALGLQFIVGKGHTIEADAPEHEFVLFDLFQGASNGSKLRGYMVSNNDTIQLIDPTIDPGAFQQTAIALANALNDLFALGAVNNIKILPVIAAPTTELLHTIQENIRAFSSQYSFEVLEQEPVSHETLLLGATVIGQTDHQPPVFYDRLQPGDQILVHRTFGDLVPINLYIESLVMGDGYLKNVELDNEEVHRAKETIVEIMARPNLAVGRLIYQYSPAVGEPFDPQRHIKITGDLSGPGIDIFREFAEKACVNMRLEKIPLAFEHLARVATQQYILPNSTAGTNGALAVIATPAVIEHFAIDLERLGYSPQVIGSVEGPGEGILSVPPVAREFIADWPQEYRLLREPSPQPTATPLPSKRERGQG